MENLKDNNDGTFWQLVHIPSSYCPGFFFLKYSGEFCLLYSRSEGPQPHLVDLSFPKRVFISVRPESHLL